MAIFVIAANIATAQNIVIRGGNVVDVENGTILENYDVVVKDGIITKVSKGSKKSIKKGEIDARGKFVSPGLIDSHVHWANFAPTFDEMKMLSKTYLESGVTTVREMGGDTRIIKEYLGYIKKRDIVGPYIYYPAFWAGPEYFKMRNGHNPNPEPTNVPWNLAITDETDFAKEIKKAQEDGSIALKLYNSISVEALNKITEECRKAGMRIWAHFCIEPATTADVVAAGCEVVSHGYLADNMKSFNVRNYADIRFSKEEVAQRAKVFEEMAQKGIIYDLTLKHHLANNLDYTVEYAKEALNNGVRVVAGTDWAYFSNDGRIICAFIDEMEIFEDNLGMSPLEVLRSATTTGAEILGMKDKLGVIKKGAEADILVLTNNPLKSVKAYRKIEKVIIDGHDTGTNNKI